MTILTKSSQVMDLAMRIDKKGMCSWTIYMYTIIIVVRYIILSVHRACTHSCFKGCFAVERKIISAALKREYVKNFDNCKSMHVCFAGMHISMG